MKASGTPMDERLLDLIETARHVVMTAEERSAQRISFAYGNAHLENPRITRDDVRRAYEDLKKDGLVRP